MQLKTNQLMLADRRLPTWIALLTLTATWVGGGYLNGTAEAVYDPDYGLVWCQAPWGFAISLMIGGLVFARPMRQRGYRTMLDLFEQRYGPRIAAVLFIPAFIGDLFWTAAILVALGHTLLTMTGMDASWSMALAMSIVVAYTVWGGLWSVAISDILQLLLIVVGLMITLPFALEVAGGVQASWNHYVEIRGDSARIWPALSAWSGPKPWGWQWLDAAFLLIFGGIPWQVYFQRVLACRSANQAAAMSVLAGLLCMTVAIAPAMIGVVGATVVWPIEAGAPPTSAAVLPHVLQYLTPTWIGIAGLTGLVCAVMSSMDSSILSSASLFTWNIYRPLRRLDDDRAELRHVLRFAVVAIGVVAFVLAVRVEKVYALWFLCADLVYVILFPQLAVAVLFPRATPAGAIAGLIVAAVMRVTVFGMTAGWSLLGPLAAYTEYWPRLTCAMLASLCAILVVSVLTSSGQSVSSDAG